MIQYLRFFGTVVVLGFMTGAHAQDKAVQYLPVCEKCLSPRVTAKSGIGTATASAEAKVIAEDAKTWCAAHQPRDPACITYEVKQGGDGGRASYRATADCTTGHMRSMNSGDYTYAGTWTEGAGRGRPMFRGPSGSIPRWESIVSGDGKARGDWDLFGGFSLAGQWEVLCPGPPPVQNVTAAAAAPARPQAAQPAPPQTQTPAICGAQPQCSEVNSFAAVLTDFRTSNVFHAKVVTAAVRFQNKLSRPIVLGYVNGSGVTTDDQGNRYTVAAPENVRGIGGIGNGQVDPKFVLRPGEFGDARFEMIWHWSGREVFGLNFEMEMVVRELLPLPSGQFRLGPEHPLRFRGLSNAVAPAAITSRAAAPAAPSPTPTEPVSAASAPEVVPAAAPGPDPCTGIARCFNAGPFIGEIQQISSSIAGGRHHVLRFSVRFRNLTNAPLILASTNNSLVVVDNQGNRYGNTPDQSVSGMGIVADNRADPQFVLRPGESRTASFQVYRRNSGKPTGMSYTFDFSLEQLEVLPSQQIRSTRQFSLTFPNLTVSAMPSTAAPAENPADAGKKIIDLLRGKKK